MSVNQKRTNSTPSDSTRSSTSLAVSRLSSTVAIRVLLLSVQVLRVGGGVRGRGGGAAPAAVSSRPRGDLLCLMGLEHFRSLLSGTDPDRILDGKEEDLPVAD